MRLELGQPALAARLRARGLARAAQFTWERTARETIAVYVRVVGGE
jgi:glycosyltransferase involved in cell wall biosynthesis